MVKMEGGVAVVEGSGRGVVKGGKESVADVPPSGKGEKPLGWSC